MAQAERQITPMAQTEPEIAPKAQPQQATRGQVGARVWLNRPAGISITVAIAFIILVAPAWLLADQIHPFLLFNDDFDFIVQSRDWAITRATLLVPHEAHVVPLFRLWTFGLVALAGRLANLPLVLSAASYLALVVTMLLVGHLVAQEARQTAVGLAAMAGLGVSTVVEPAVRWYSAGQPLWAGAAIVLTILLARNWCLKGGRLRLAAAALASLAAPALWTGGVVAGPAGIAYLWARRSCRSRGLSLALAGATACFLLLFLAATRHQIQENKVIWQQHEELWPRPIQAVLHTAQAIAETLVLGNLGLDATVSSFQAVALVLGLAGIWFWSRGGMHRLNPLEAAGAAVVLASYLLIYTFRGNHPYVSLRPAGWYQLIAQVGMPIFVSGWWIELRRTSARTEPALAPAESSSAGAGNPDTAPSPPHEPSSGRLTRKEAIVVLALASVLYFMQAPRALAILLRSAPPLSKSEQRMFPILSLQRTRAMYFRNQSHDRQVRALARTDLARPIAMRLGASPEALRHTFGHLMVPGTFAGQDTCDMVGLLHLPPQEPKAQPDAARIRAALGHLLSTESEPRPIWLDPKDPWPPAP
ncbi:MAG TPA: hypothetical protein VGZ22_24025 [Isosphaeraceae bacterium]|jgi:hypothetical protein|nr:hypothetical protein [Isosphaeraceae bacterium]